MHNYFLIKIVIPFLLLISTSVSAQNILSTHYSKDNGLKAEYVKSIAKDSIGYLWLGSDNGLIRYNGLNFKEYGSSQLHSDYVKQLLQKKDGSLYAITDKEIVRIYSTPDNVSFDILMQTKTPEADEGDLHYGKLLYEDRTGTLWAADNHHIFKETSPGKFEVTFSDFDLVTEATSRSFQLAENINGELFAFHISGKIYKFDADLNEFQYIGSTKLSNIQHVIWYNGSSFLVADASKGVSLLEIDGKKITRQQIGQKIDASYIQEIGTDVYMVSGYLKGMYRLEGTYEGFKLHRSSELGVYNGNAMLYDDLDLWLARDNGISLFQQLPFNQYASNITNSFIQHINGDGKNLYFSDGDNLYFGEINSLNEFTLNKKIKVTPSGNSILRVLPTKDGVWTSDAEGTLKLWRNGQPVKKINLSHLGGAIFVLKQDLNGDLWICQDGVAGVIKIGKNDKPKIYSVEEGVTSRAISVEVTKDNEILLGGTTKEALVFQYNDVVDSFDNLTEELNFKLDGNIQTNDLTKMSNGDVILGTSYGTLILKDEKIRRLNLGDFTSISNNAIAVDPSEQQLWISTPTGLIRYNFEHNEYLLYTNKDGLPDGTLNHRGLYIDEYGKLFIATTRGIGFAPNLQVLKETPKPFIEEIHVGGDKIDISSRPDVSSDSYLRVGFHIPVYPTENVAFQKRILGYPGLDEWTNFDKESEGLLIDQLEAGSSYTLEIRGRKTGNFSWSRPLSFRFSVYKPFYKQWWSYVLYLVATISIILVIVQLNILRSRREQKRLEEQVNLRTKEVEQQSSELTEKNSELEKAFNRLKRSEAILNHNTKELERAKREADKAVSKLKDKNTELEETSRTIREQHQEMKSHREQILRQNELVKEQALLLSQHNDKVKSSVNYARRMQTAVFGQPSEMADKMKAIGQHWDGFVYLKPRDIVSGDFHWIGEKNENYIIVAADCTGHGVPGAFMSLIGNDLLNQIVYERGILDPGRILKLMNDMIRQALNQAENENSRDGMDIAICVVSPKRKTLTFAGAGRPLYYIDQNDPGELKRLKSGKFGIGGKSTKKKVFDSHSLPLETIKALFICSDGYQDQFGGPNGRKLMQKPFKELLYSIHDLDGEEQNKALTEFMDQWMLQGNQRQIDDMLIIGLKPHVITDEEDDKELLLVDEHASQRHSIF